jgi:hypothetical protein
MADEYQCSPLVAHFSYEPEASFLRFDSTSLISGVTVHVVLAGFHF